MPLDPRIVSIIGESDPEQERGDSRLLIDPYVEKMMEAADGANKARQDYLRRAYVYGLNAPLPATRNTYIEKVVKEIKDPKEREFIIGETAKVASTQAWAQRKEYEEKGFTGRFMSNFSKLGGGFVAGGTQVVESAKGIAQFVAGKSRSKEDVTFARNLDSVVRNVNPYVPKHVKNRWALKGAVGAMEMSAPAAGGLLAGTQGGPAAMAAYWAGLDFPGSRDDYTEMGLNDTSAALAGAATAGVIGSIEALVNFDPTGLVKKAARIPAKGFAKKAVGEVLRGGRRAAFETTEEVLQESARETGAQVASQLSEDVKARPITDIGTKGAEQVAETALPISIASMAGAGGRVASLAKRYKSMGIELEQGKIYDSILEHDVKGEPPSRTAWTNVWGMPIKEVGSRVHRRQTGAKLASEVRSLLTSQYVIEGITPTAKRGELLNIPDEHNATEEGRRRYLHGQISEGKTLMEGDRKAEHQAKQEQAAEAAAVAEAAPPGQQDIVEPSPEVDLNNLATSEGDGAFVKDTSGSVGVSLDLVSKAARKHFKKTRGYMKEYLTTKGELPAEIFEAKIRRDGRVLALKNKISVSVVDFNRAAKKELGTDILTPKQQEVINSALAGEIDIKQMPKELQKPLANMRKMVDELSIRLIEIGAVQGDMATVVAENVGTYLTRSYRIFSEGQAWVDKIPADVRNRVIYLLKEEYPDRSEKEIHGLLENIIHEAKMSGSLIDMFSSGKLGSKDLSILTRRKEVPPEIRALFGEYKDPRANFVRSVAKIGDMIANHQFLLESKEAGLGKYFNDIPIVNEYGDLKEQIAPAGNKTMSPLNVYTTPEIAKAFRQQLNQNPNWLRIVLLTNAVVKGGKTVLSPMTHARNTVSNAGFAIMQGHWRVGHFGKAFKTVWADFRKRGDDERRGYTNRLYELGLLGEDVVAGELNGYIRDISDYDTLEDMAYDSENRARRWRKTRRAFKQTVASIVKLYQLEDAIWKIYAFENEKSRYGRAKPGLSDAELEQQAATIVRNTFPTYSMVPKGVRALRNFPLYGTFVSFPSEVLRTSYHTIKLLDSELKDPQLRKIGAERLAGTVAAAFSPYALSATLRLLSGVSKQDDDDMRLFIAPWQENNILLQFGQLLNDNFRFLDLGFTDPHNIIRAPLKAFFRGEDIKDGLWDALKEISEPFVGTEILFGAFEEARTNNADGSQVWNPEDDVDKQAEDIGKYMWNSAFEPGFMRSLKRIKQGFQGKETPSGVYYNPWTEILAMTTGQRIQEIDIKQSLAFKFYDFKKRKRNAEKILSEVIFRRGEVSEQEIFDSYNRSEDSRENLYRHYIEVVAAAGRLTMEEGEIFAIAKSAGITKSDADSLYYGLYEPKSFSNKYFDIIEKVNPDSATQRMTALEAASVARRQAASAGNP